MRVRPAYFPSGSLAENVNVALFRTVNGSGPVRIVVSGGVWSTGGVRICQLWTAGEPSMLPFRSIERTSNRCQPSARPGSFGFGGYSMGEVHGPQAPSCPAGMPSGIAVIDEPAL